MHIGECDSAYVPIDLTILVLIHYLPRLLSRAAIDLPGFPFTIGYTACDIGGCVEESRRHS
jgi:hypothetical protein